MKIVIECNSVQELMELASAISSKTSGEKYEYPFYAPPVEHVSTDTSSVTSSEEVQVPGNEALKEDSPPVVTPVEVPKRKYEKSTTNQRVHVGHIDDEIVVEVQRRLNETNDSLAKICKDMNIKYRTVYDRVIIPKNRIKTVDHVRAPKVEESVMTEKQERILNLYDNEKLSAKEISIRTGISYATVSSTIIRKHGHIEKRKLSQELLDKKAEDKEENREEDIKHFNEILDDPNNELKRTSEMFPPITDELTETQQQQVVNFFNHKKTDGGKYSIQQISDRVGIPIELVKRVIHNDKRIKS
jgi:predicted DNA-binding protein YlxM (UPF0122 family)